MNAPEYSLPLLNESALRRARRWLLLGVVALGVGGIFAGMLGAVKEPLFSIVLTEHVDLSELIWFMTMAGMFFALSGIGRVGLLADAAFYAQALGLVCVVASSLTHGEAYLSNYVPVIYHPLFFLGSALVTCGLGGMIIYVWLNTDGALFKSALRFGVFTAACIMAVADICFIWSSKTMPAEMRGQIYYEYLFWSGGHVMQFMHAQLLLVCWLWLAEASGIRLVLKKCFVIALFAIQLIIVAGALLIHFLYGVTSDEFRDAFTWMMKQGNGLASGIIGLALVYGFIVSPIPKEKKLPYLMLLSSLTLYLAGGVLSFLIRGSNVIIPAHYHGEIIGITLSFMGVAYLLLPKFGWADVSHSKLALVQPVIYGGGQLCWMAGMMILGSHGVPRKTPGSADTVGAFASSLKHAGDGIALIGGLLFVFIVLRAVWKRKTV